MNHGPVAIETGAAGGEQASGLLVGRWLPEDAIPDTLPHRCPAAP